MKLSYGLFVIVFLTGLDQCSKMWIDRNIPLNDSIPIIPNFIGIAHIKNSGVSFGFLGNLPDSLRLPLLIGVSTIVSIAMLYYLIRHWSTIDRFMKIALILILPGAFGNLLDRALYGVVTDFIQFCWFEINFFSNNLADCFISIGFIFLILSAFFGAKEKSALSSEVIEKHAI